PRISERRAPRMRATVSDALPAANGTPTVTRPGGQTCPAAGMIPAAKAAAPVKQPLLPGLSITLHFTRPMSTGAEPIHAQWTPRRNGLGSLGSTLRGLV